MMYLLVIRYRDVAGNVQHLGVFTSQERARAFANIDNGEPLEWRSNGFAGYPQDGRIHIYIVSLIDVDPTN